MNNHPFVTEALAFEHRRDLRENACTDRLVRAARRERRARRARKRS